MIAEATVLLVGADPARYAGNSFHLEAAADADAAVRRLEVSGEPVDVLLLAPELDDPVRVAQRLHVLDREAAVVIHVSPEHEGELAQALRLAPFLEGDVTYRATAEPASLGPALAEAAERTRERRAARAAAERAAAEPPPLTVQHLGDLLDSAPIGVATLDSERRLLGWNRRAGQMLRRKEIEALAHPFAELFPERERARLEALLRDFGTRDLRGPGEVFEYEPPEDGVLYLQVTGAGFMTREGEPGSIVVLQDVTQRLIAERERDEAEAQLRLQNALLEAESEASDAGIVVISQDGRIASFNRRFVEVWGFGEEAKVGARREGLVQAALAKVEDPGQFLAGVERLAREPTAEWRDELRLRDGRVLERIGKPVLGPDGSVTGRVWFTTDVSRRKREEARLRFLMTATEILSSSFEYEKTLAQVAELAVPEIADWAAVEVVAPGGTRQLAVAHADPEKVELARRLQLRYPPDPASPRGPPAVVRSGRAELYPEIPDELLVQAAVNEEHLEMLRALQMRSAMVVPIRTTGPPFGAITFVSAESRMRYGEEDLALAEELARRAAIAIENARLHEQLAVTARTLQTSLLPPHLPDMPGVEAAARFRPATAQVDVGGDFYDLFEIADGCWALVMGDVCGKGAEAAALTALARYTLRAVALEDRAPSPVLEMLNEALLRGDEQGRFCTVVYAVLDLSGERPELAVASGGHPLPLLLRADGSVREVGRAGSLLGVLPGVSFAEERTALEQGDTLVFYTDGLTDAGAPGRLLDEQDIGRAVAGYAGLGPAEIAERLEAFGLGDAAEPRDDIALLVLRIVSGR